MQASHLGNLAAQHYILSQHLPEQEQGLGTLRTAVEEARAAVSHCNTLQM